MLCKLIGSICLLGAGGYAALTLHRYEQRRMAVLDGYMALLYYIKGEIDCYARPITDILASADPAIIAACLGLPTGAVQACDPPPVSLSSMVAIKHLLAYMPISLRMKSISASVAPFCVRYTSSRFAASAGVSAPPFQPL